MVNKKSYMFKLVKCYRAQCVCVKNFNMTRKAPQKYQECFNDSRINYLNVLEKRKDEYYWRSIPVKDEKNNMFLL